MGSYVLLGAEFSHLIVREVPLLQLNSEDSLRRSEVIIVDIRHERLEFVSEGWFGRMRGNAVLARVSSAYMRPDCGVSTFKLPYRFRGVYVLLIDPFVIRVGVSLPFDKILLLP